MTLPAPGNPISANMINVEATRSGTTNAPMSGSSSTPQAGSLVKLYAPPNSDVDQTAPHAYSEFYSKTWTPRTVFYYSQYYYNTTTPFANVYDACSSSTWYSSNSGSFYYSGTLGNGTVCYDAASGSALEFASAVTSPVSLKSTRTGTPTHSCTIDSSSAILDYAVCPTLTAFNSSGETTSVAVCSETIYPNPWYHTGINAYPEQGDWVFENNGNYQPVLTTGSEWFKSQQGLWAYRLQNATPGPGYVNSDNLC